MEREDYDTAKEKKQQVDRIRQQVYDQLDVQGLLSRGAGAGGVHRMMRSTERSNHHPRVKNPPFTALSTNSAPFSGHEHNRYGERKK